MLWTISLDHQFGPARALARVLVERSPLLEIASELQNPAGGGRRSI